MRVINQGRSSRNAKFESSKFKRVLILCLALLTAGLAACSAPVMQDYDELESFDDPYRAYQACVQAMTPYGREYECDQMSPSDGAFIISYDEYIYGPPYGESGYRKGTASPVTDADRQQAWRAYLAQLNEADQAILIAYWTQLSNDY